MFTKIPFKIKFYVEEGMKYCPKSNIVFKKHLRNFWKYVKDFLRKKKLKLDPVGFEPGPPNLLDFYSIKSLKTLTFTS